MKKMDEFYIGYSAKMGKSIRRVIRKFVLITFVMVVLVAFSFSYFQVTAANSSFDFSTPTQLSGVYHESPYPMLRVRLEEDSFKDIVLLGFGKFGPQNYLGQYSNKDDKLLGKRIGISGNLIYYNGKTLVQIDEDYELRIDKSSSTDLIVPEPVGTFEIEGEIVDPKCYFGVMKPGYGKIHRSCAALCISGGIPPVLVARDQNSIATYFLITDLKGNPIYKDIVPYIGQPALIKGQVSRLGNWHLLSIKLEDIKKLKKGSSVY